MAESVVSFLLETLASEAMKEVTLLKKVGKEIADIKDEFSFMQAFLKDADAKQEVGNERVKVWVKKVRDAAYETEDILYEFLFLRGQRRRKLIRNLNMRHELANRIEDLKTKVKEISRRTGSYGLNKLEEFSASTTSENNRQRDPRKDALFLEEAQLVGIDKSRNQLIGWLVDDKQSSAIGILPVYGEGGLGKTTLVKKVFDNQTIMDHFPYRAWVTLSETYEIKTLLVDLIRQLLKEVLRDDLKDMEATELMNMLLNHLHGKRYVVVLDDIWRIDAWNTIKHAFSNDECCSRIIVTTRSKDIADQCALDIKYAFKFLLPHLTSRDALQLFCKVVFASNDVNSCPEDLFEISQNFLRKCNGLPLAIVSIGGLLRKKESMQWRQVYENLRYMMGSNQELKDLSTILALSYTDLPYHLKSCFLYLSIFPEDCSIKCKRLVRFWVSEGFVERQPGMASSVTMEDIARGYLDELISRSLIQVEVVDLAGRVKTCRVHDILREFIILKAHEQDLVAHIGGRQDDIQGQQGTGRHLSMLENISLGNLSELLERKKRLFSTFRSFTVIEHWECNHYIWSSLFSSFRLLRVLDMGESYLDEFPTEISNLVCLKHLSIDVAFGVPSSIGKLTNLEILMMKRTSLNRLPREILNMKSLRYLALAQLNSSCKMLARIDMLTNLEKLSVIHAGWETNSNMVKRLGMLTQMRSLHIKKVREEDMKELFTSLAKMNYLRSIRLHSEYWSKGQCVWSPPGDIQKLYMEGPLQKCPDWFSKLQHLMKLTLCYSNIEDKSFLQDLQTLPNLVVLKLCRAFAGKLLVFHNGGFSRLKLLELDDLACLSIMQVEKGAMPSIQKLRFRSCLKLDIIPLGIQHLSSLKSVHTRIMPRDFDERLKKLIWKGGHAPLILCEQNSG